MEEHSARVRGMPDARGRASRSVWSVLEEVPAIEPSFGFDSRVRQRIAAEPRRTWFEWFVPQPRLASSRRRWCWCWSVWVAKLPQRSPVLAPTTAANESEQFQEIKDLGVLDNYEVLTNFDALSELTPAPTQPSEKPNHPSDNGNGGA